LEATIKRGKGSPARRSGCRARETRVDYRRPALLQKVIDPRFFFGDDAEVDRAARAFTTAESAPAFGERPSR